jgi:hypothetical protein
VSSISLSLDGRYVLSGSFDKTVKLWEIATGECVKTFEGHTDYVVAVDLSADAKYALSVAGRPYQSASENTLRMWEVSTGKCIQTIEGPQEAFTSVRLSTDNKFALSGSSEFYQMPKRENAYYVERHLNTTRSGYGIWLPENVYGRLMVTGRILAKAQISKAMRTG